MNYKKVYFEIIEKAKTKTYDTYCENHHIIPRCQGGSDDKNNKVKLSYREHFICHWLLCKIYPKNHKLKSSFCKMLEVTKTKKRVVSSWMFEAVKKNIKNTHYYWLKNKTPWNKGKKGVQIAWNKGLTTGPKKIETNIKTSETLKKLYKIKTHPRKNKTPWNKGKKGVQIAWNKGLTATSFLCKNCNRNIAGASNFKRWHGENCKNRLLRVG